MGGGYMGGAEGVRAYTGISILSYRVDLLLKCKLSPQDPIQLDEL